MKLDFFKLASMMESTIQMSTNLNGLDKTMKLGFIRSFRMLVMECKMTPDQAFKVLLREWNETWKYHV